MRTSQAEGRARGSHTKSGTERESEVVRTNKRPSEAVMEQGKGKAKKCGGANGRWSSGAVKRRIGQKQRTTKRQTVMDTNIGNKIKNFKNIKIQNNNN